jgi:hypothetical protein
MEQKTQGGHRKGIWDSFHWHTCDHEGKKVFSCQFDNQYQTILSSANSALLSSGFATSKNNTAWHPTKGDTKRVLIPHMLTHVASKRQPTVDPDWPTHKLQEDMRGEIDKHISLPNKNDRDHNDVIFGVLFFGGDDVIFLVPNVIEHYHGGWSHFSFRDIGSG